MTKILYNKKYPQLKWVKELLDEQKLELKTQILDKIDEYMIYGEDCTCEYCKEYRKLKKEIKEIFENGN